MGLSSDYLSAYPPPQQRLVAEVREEGREGRREGGRKGKGRKEGKES